MSDTQENDEIKVSVEEVKKPTIMIATPMYGGMCTGGYVHGLLRTIAKCRDLGIKVFWAHMMNESLITRARNEMVRTFLEHDFDYLMFIDADIGFDEVAVLKLLVGDRDIACGLYPKKEIDWKQVSKAAKEGKEDLQDYSASFVLNTFAPDAVTDDDGMIEVRHGGTGFMLIKRRVFELLAPHVPTFRISSIIDPETGQYKHPTTYEFFATSIDETGALLSEDYHFCELWQRHGGKVYAQPFIKLQHIGTYIYNGDIVKAGGNVK